MKYSDFLMRCYELYKNDWCNSRGVSVSDVDEDVGINGGECFVCLAEFEQAEFQDVEYMKGLLNNTDLLQWMKFNKSISEIGEVGIKVFFDRVHVDTVWVPKNELDVTINSIARNGYENYNGDVKKDWERIMGPFCKPTLSFEVLFLDRLEEKVNDNIKAKLDSVIDMATKQNVRDSHDCKGVSVSGLEL